MLFGKGRKKFTLPRNIVMHWNHDRGFNLVDYFHNVVEAKIGHRIDGNHHDVDPLQYLFLLRSKKMPDVAQVRHT